jgi:acetylornithine deacetylase/succinyl-diaminopimelate desuccinylase-like protein
LEKLVLGQDGERQALTPEKARLLANIRLIPPEQVAEQHASFEALLSRLGVAASDEEVEQYLSEREPVEPEPNLKPEAVMRLRERIAQAKQVP